MVKKELIDSIKTKTADYAFTTKEVEAMLDAVSDTIMEVMAQGDSVKLGSVCTFSGIEKASRVARNPHDGTTVTVPAKTGVPKCKFSTTAKNNATVVG